MAEYVTHSEENGAVHIAEDVIAAIVSDAVQSIEGVGSSSQNTGEKKKKKKALRNVRVEQIDDMLTLDVSLMARYGYAIPEVAKKVQSAVSDAVGGMTGFPIREVNVHIGGVSFND